MEEEIKEIIEEKMSEEKPENIKSPIIEAARLENDRKEQLLKQEKELLERREKLHAEQMLGGNSPAGQIPRQETEDEKWAREAKIRYDGTGLDPTD